MISYQEALKLVLTYQQEASVQKIPLRDAASLVSHETIYAKMSVPSFRNSAMDGFCLAEGRPTNQKTFKVQHTIAAGNTVPASTDKSIACEIMTGAPVPEGFDTVVPVENVKITQSKHDVPCEIQLLAPYNQQKHIREQGEDYQRGDLILSAGECLGAEAIAALSSQGISHIDVKCKPKIGLITTGSEIVEPDGNNLPAGKIWNSNAAYLQAKLDSYGAQTQSVSSTPDEPEQFKALLTELMNDPSCNMVVSTGAVSAGRYDFIVEVLKEIGAEIIFHKVKIRPGKPILFASLPSGQVFFGLPGNPSSAAVGARFFIQPWIMRYLGKKATPTYQAVLSNTVHGHERFCFFKKAKVYIEQSTLACDVLSGQESFKIKPLLLANAWAILPGRAKAYQAGERVEVVGINNYLEL